MQIKRLHVIVVSTIITVAMFTGCGNKKETSDKTNQVSDVETKTDAIEKEEEPLVPKNATIEEIPISEIKAIMNTKKTLYFDGYKNDVKGVIIGSNIGYVSDDMKAEKIILKNTEIDTDHTVAMDRKGQLYIGQRDEETNKHYVMKVLKDGTKQKIVEIPNAISSIYFNDDKLYVITEYTLFSSVYSANIDGGDLKELAKFEAESDPFIVAIQKNIMIVNDDKKYRRVYLDGILEDPIKGDKKDILIKDIQDIRPIKIQDGYIYADFTGSDDDDEPRSINRINIKTSVREKIIKLTGSNDSPTIIGIQNNRLYYTRSAYLKAGIYTSDLDGKNEERLNDISIQFDNAAIEGNYIYFSGNSDIWVYRLDGSASAKIVDTLQNKLALDTDYLSENYNTKYKVSKETVSITELESAFLSQNYIYYFRLVDSEDDLEETQLVRANLDGTNPIRITRYDTSTTIVD